jgi:two-component sensor histidine kinase
LRQVGYRLAEFDVIDQLSNRYNPALVQAGFGLTCTALMVVGRVPVDAIAPTAGPFALIYPVTLIATLFGRWPSGVVTAATSFLWAWYYVLPDPWSFHFARVSDVARLIVNLASVAIVLVLAEIFRQAVRKAADERDAELKHSELLLRELDHRTKNNFMIVGSLLDLQRRRQTSPEARAALEAAAGRVHSFAAANQALYEDDHGSETLSMAPYLTSLTSHIGSALFLPDSVTLTIVADDAQLPRDQAVSIGVVLNEAVTNAAKHAFTPDQASKIQVKFSVESEHWRLTISDNGRGFSQKPGSSGLGSSLIEAFAARAGATIERSSLEPGTRVCLNGRLTAIPA